METVIFSINLEIKEDDITELRAVIQDFFMKKAETKVAEKFRPKNMTEKPSKDFKDSWVLLGDRVEIGELNEQTFNDLLDSVKIRQSYATAFELSKIRKPPFSITVPISSNFSM
jgi:hypothetical protein